MLLDDDVKKVIRERLRARFAGEIEYIFLQNKETLDIYRRKGIAFPGSVDELSLKILRDSNAVVRCFWPGLGGNSDPEKEEINNLVSRVLLDMIRERCRLELNLNPPE